jgi:hypothetical protein
MIDLRESFACCTILCLSPRYCHSTSSVQAKRRCYLLEQGSRYWIHSGVNSIKKEKMIKSEPGFPVFREAVSAIYWPALCWLEGDFALFSTVCADCLCHFSGTEVSRTTKTLSLHCITLAAFNLPINISAKSINTSAPWRKGCPPVKNYSGDDLAPVEFFMGKICKMDNPLIDEILHTGKNTRQAGMKILYGTADYPALSYPPRF